MREMLAWETSVWGWRYSCVGRPARRPAERSSRHPTEGQNIVATAIDLSDSAGIPRTCLRSEMISRSLGVPKIIIGC